MKESIFPGNLREKVTDSILSNSPDRVYFPPLWFSLGKSICCDSRHIFTAVAPFPMRLKKRREHRIGNQEPLRRQPDPPGLFHKETLSEQVSHMREFLLQACRKTRGK